MEPWRGGIGFDRAPADRLAPGSGRSVPQIGNDITHGAADVRNDGAERQHGGKAAGHSDQP